MFDVTTFSQTIVSLRDLLLFLLRGDGGYGWGSGLLLADSAQ